LPGSENAGACHHDGLVFWKAICECGWTRVSVRRPTLRSRRLGAATKKVKKRDQERGDCRGAKEWNSWKKNPEWVKAPKQTDTSSFALIWAKDGEDGGGARSSRGSSSRDE